MDPHVAAGVSSSSEMVVDKPVPGSSKERTGRPRAQSVPYKYPDFTVGFVYSSDMMIHFSPHPQGHPEKPARIEEIWLRLTQASLCKRMKWLPIREVRKEEALLVHSEDHWDKVVALQHITNQQIADTEEYYEQMSLYVMPGTTHASLLSCGGVIEASLSVARNELKRTFAIVRPPGHHAEPDEHMGFCFFNNVAVAARVVQQMTKRKRILIVDWDVHHGNGTQRAFNDDPSVLYVSIHRYENGTYYPCGTFGAMDSAGEGAGLGFSLNVPWPEAGMGDAEYIYAFQKVIMPIAMEFAPELVIISAGFDAAAGDDLGECEVSPAGYAHMTHMLCGLAGGRVVVALEGGYNLDSISRSAEAVTRILLGEAPPELPPLRANEAATETVWLVAREMSKYWTSVDPKACDPRQGLEQITFSIPEILKAHRQHYLYTTYDMMQIPLLTGDMEERFSTQIMCSSNMFFNKNLIVFVHEFGNLRLELESSATCDLHLERSYMIDVSKELIEWTKQKEYSLIDVNLFPKPSETALPRNKNMEEIGREILLYIWDNYVQLSSAQNIVLIGHGPGCKPLIDLVNRRLTSILKSVQAIIQILGPQRMPTVPSDPELGRPWYFKSSLVIIPSIHPLMSPNVRAKDLRKHGSILPLDEPRQIRLISKGFPAIKAFVEEALNKALVPTTTTRKTA